MSAAAGPLKLDNTMGALFVGIMLAAALWGASALQTWDYYLNYKKDGPILKVLVGVVFALDTVHQALISHILYTYLVTEYGQPAFLLEIVWSLLVQVIFSSIIAALVQSFFVWRVWKLSHSNIWLTSFLFVLVLAEFAVSIAYFVKGWPIKSFLEIGQLTGLSRAVNILALVTDTFIAAVLVYFLQTSKTGFRRSDSIVNRLIIFALNTGLFTSVDAMFSLIFNTASPTTFIYMAFYAPLARLYTNSLLATLNARNNIKRAGSSPTTDISLGNVSVERYQTYKTAGSELDFSKKIKSSRNGLAVQVDTQTTKIVDGHESPYSDSKNQSFLETSQAV